MEQAGDLIRVRDLEELRSVAVDQAVDLRPDLQPGIDAVEAVGLRFQLPQHPPQALIFLVHFFRLLDLCAVILVDRVHAGGDAAIDLRDGVLLRRLGEPLGRLGVGIAVVRGVIIE